MPAASSFVMKSSGIPPTVALPVYRPFGAIGGQSAESIVDLPLPFVPHNTQSSPFCTRKETLSSAFFSLPA